MGLFDLYTKAKKKIHDTFEPIEQKVSSSLGSMASGVRKTLNSPAPQWMQNVDQGLRRFSTAAENVPKFHFAEEVKNPVGRFGAEVVQGIANIPSKTISVTLKDYGKTKTNPSYLIKRGAEAANIGVDIGSLFAGGPIVKNLAKEGLKKTGKATLGTVFKQGAKVGARDGLAYGATSGALSGLQEGDNLKEQGKNALKQGAIGGVMGIAAGGVLGGAIPAAGHEVGSVKKDIKNLMNPYAKRIVTKFEKEPTGAFAPGGVPQMRDVPGTAKTFVETVKMPFKPQSATGKLLFSRPGLTIEDVNAKNPRVVSSKKLDEKIAAKINDAKELVGRQLENQRKGLNTAEKGFVSPGEVKAPQKPNLGQIKPVYRVKSQAEDAPFKGDEFSDNFKTLREAVAKKKAVMTEKTPFEAPEGGYNKYQQAAYDKKVERSKAVKDFLSQPTQLRSMGYKKTEIDRIGKDQAERIIKLGNLGYPKNEIQKMDFDRMDLIIKKSVPWTNLKKYYERKHSLDTDFLEGIDPAELKDINPAMTYGRDVFRNFEVAFGKNFPKIKSQLLDPFDQAKGNLFTEQEQLAKELHENIVKKFGISKGSKMSEYVQKWGENKFIRPLEESDIPDAIKQQINFAELKNLAEKTAKGDWRILVAKKLEELPEQKRQVVLSQLQKAEPKKWQNVIEADKWFRNKYETLLADLNKVREENFPTHPLYPESSKIIPFRKDYYRHFKDNEGFAGLKNMFEGPSSIDPALAASSDVTNPKTKWLSFAQRRKGDKTEYDAVGGFEDYLKNHAYAKHIDPFIQKFKGIDDETKQGLPAGSFFHETRGLAEELSQKMDPLQQITDSTDSAKIQKILTDHGMSETQSGWMSKELAGISNYEKVKQFIKNKTSKNKENILGKMEPKALAEGSENQENNFLTFIKNYSRDLAGKTNPVDRPFQEGLMGRKALSIINWANSRFKANAVLGNLSSSVAQFFNIPQGFASAGMRNSAKGFGDSLADIFRKDAPINKSSFIRERYFNAFDKFDEGILNNTKKFAVWMTGVGDKVGTRFIWNSHYRKALSEGVADPVKYADDWTRKMVAGRGIGEVPIAQKSKIVQMVAPFQLEVANQWYALRDLAKNDPRKLVMAKKLLEFSVASFIMNQVAKEIRGSDVSFDPINALSEAYGEYQKEGDKIKGTVKAGGRVAGEIFSNMPGGNIAASMYPEYGFGINKENFPTLAKVLNNQRKDFFGEGDPTRFGTGGLPMFSAIKNPLTGVVLPYGGKQVEKTYSGAKALLKGYAENNTGKVMTPVERSFSNDIKGLMFGKNALNEVRDYFDNNQTPLSDLQTEKFKLAGGKEFYDRVMAERNSNKEAEALKSGKPTKESKQLSDDMYQLSNGKIFVKSLNQEFKSEKEAKIGIAKEDLANSKNNFMDLGDVVLRKNADGTVVSQRKDGYMVQLNTAKMSGFKKNKDLESWKKTADEQYALLNKMMEDPSIDEYEKTTIQNKIDTLETEFLKYKGYGGFTKGKKAKETKSVSYYENPNADPVMLAIARLRAFGKNPSKSMIGKRMPSIARTRITPKTRRKQRLISLT